MAANGSVSVRVEGASKLRKQFAAAHGNLADLSAIHKAIAAPVAEVARKLVPENSGALKRTIRVGATRTSGSVVAGNQSVGKWGKGVVYAAIVEYGNPKKNKPARRYITRAVAATRGETARRYEQAMRMLLLRHGIDLE